MQGWLRASRLSDDRSQSRCCNQNEPHQQPLRTRKQDALQFQPYPMKLDNKYLTRKSGIYRWCNDQYDESL